MRKTPEKRASGGAWNRAHPEYRRAYQRKYQTGWLREEFEVSWAAQDGRCAICRDAMVDGGVRTNSVAADHCHETGRRRDLLCVRCNRGLGHFQHDPARLETASAYLGRHRAEKKRRTAY